MRRKAHQPARRRAAPSPRHARWIAGGLVVVAALLVYANTLNNPFVYDDFHTVVANPSLRPPLSLEFVLVHSPFRPVVNLSYALDRAVWGFRPAGFHLTNTLLHATMAGLVFLLITGALTDARERRGEPAGADGLDVLAASAAAVLFAVHPLMSSAVAYVSGRSELLCGVFFAAGLLCARSAMSRGDLARPDASPARPAADRHRLVGALAILLGALAVLSKEVAVVLPLVVLAYDWLVLPASPAVQRRRFWTVFVPILSLMAVAAAFRLATLSAVGGGTAAAPLQSILTHSIVIWRYLGLLILPIGQSIMHGVRTVTAPTDPVGLIACGALVAAVAMAIRFRRAEPLAAFGIVWFVAAIAPSSSFVALREGMAEHRVYVASAGLLAAFGALSRRALVRMAGASPRAPVGYISAVLVVASVLSALTLARNNVWADPARLWSEAVEHAPGMWEPLYALGDALRTAGRCPEAVPEYERVVAIKPDHRDAHTNLGICLGESGRLREAEASFRRVLEIDPRSARAYSNLGAVALLAGEPDRARDFYVQAIAADPRAVLARMQLAHLYEKTYHDYHAAARLCGEARAIDPATRGVIECVERNQKLAAAADQGR